MEFSIITLFPKVFEPILNSSMLYRAQKKGLVKFNLVNLRDFGLGRHQVVDGRPYSGGPGMLLRADVLAQALRSITEKRSNKNQKVILTTPSGRVFNQKKAKEFSEMEHIIIICGHYEGIDERFTKAYVDQEISIGDYILTGGEIPAIVIIDSVTRLIKGVLNKDTASSSESFEENLLEYPQYTRPLKFEGKTVPKVLRSGNHQEILEWKRKKSISKTKKVRPDLLK